MVQTHHNEIEINYYPAVPAKGIIIFWPGWLIDFKASFYEIPINDLVTKGYSVLLYNPPGHGQSAGIFNVDKSIAELSSFLEKNALTQLSLIGVSHSGGCNAIIKAANTIKNFNTFFLFSPVFDSRRSITFMYENNSYHEFIKSLMATDPEKNLHIDVLNDSRWMELEHWNSMNYSKLLDYSIVNHNKAYFQSIAKILEATVFPGHIAWDHLASAQSVHVFIPHHDNWFPRNELIKKLDDLNICYTLLPEGTNHFLIKYWKNNWEMVNALLP